MCGEVGHWATWCKRKNDPGNVWCYTCGERGHITQWCRSKRGGVRCWKCGVEGHRERDCRVGESERASGGCSGGQYETGKNRGRCQTRISDVWWVKREREEWEQRKIKAILDTGCWGNLCGLK